MGRRGGKWGGGGEGNGEEGREMGRRGGKWGGGGEGNGEEGREMGRRGGGEEGREMRRGEGKRSESYLKAGSACAERRVEAHSSNPFAAYNDMCHGHCYHGYTSTHSSM